MTVTALQTGANNITLTSTSTIDEDADNTDADITLTTGTLTLTAQGAIGASGGNGALDLTVDGLQATTTTGGIFVLESSVLVIRGTGVQTTGANAPIEITVTAGDLVLDEDVTADGSGNVTLTVLGAGSALITGGANDDIVSTSGAITITADVMTLAAANITSSGALILQPNAAGTAIGLGGGAGGAFNLDATELGLLSDGFTSITIGKTDSGAVDINAFTFLDPVTIQGAAMVVTALQAGSNNITLTSTSTIDEDLDNTTVDITTSGTLALTAQGAIGVSAGTGELDLVVGTLQATTTTGGIFLLEADGLIIGGTGVQTTGGNAAIEITLTLGNLTLNEDITADGSGNVTLTLSAVNAAVITSDAVDDIASGSGNITITADILTLATGTISSSGALVLQPDGTAITVGVSGGQGGETFNLSTTEIDLLSDGFSSITIGRSDGTSLMAIATDVYRDPMVFRMGGAGGDITLFGNITSATANTALTFTAGTGNSGTFTQGAFTIASGSGNITITADTVVLSTSANSITGTGTITLEPSSASRTIVIGAAGGVTDFALNVNEIAALTNGFSSITIGKADSGAVTISAITFNDPVTIQGAAITVDGLAAGSNNITLTSTSTIDELLDNNTVDITTTGTLAMTAAGGAIGVSTGTNRLDLAVGTLQATTDTGGIFVLQATALIIGGTGVQTTANDAAIEIELTLGDLTLNEDITANGSGAVTLLLAEADKAVITSDAADDIASTSGAITITADRLTLAGGTISSTGGALVLQPNAASETIGLGDSATGDFNLTATELGLLSDGFSSITIGKTDSGAVDINAFTFLDPVTIQGAAMTVTALAAGSLNITLTSTSTIDEDADDTTADITTSGILNLTAQGAIGASGGNGALDLAVGTLVATTNAGGIFLREASGLTIGSGNVQTSAADAAIEIALTLGNLTLDGDITANGSGNVTLTLSGAGAAVITSAGTDNIASTSGDITITADALTLVTGTIASSGALILQPNAVGTVVGVSGGAGAFSISTTELDLLSDGFSSITIGRSDGTGTLTINADVFRDPMVFRMGGASGDILTVGILTSAVANTALTFTAGTGDGSFTMTLGAGNTIASGTGAITITADVVVLNTTANTITGTGASTITLQPATGSTTIGISDGASGTFDLDLSEIGAVTDGFSLITIGASGGTGAVDINAFTFNDPVTIRGGAMVVTALQSGGTIITLTSTSTIDEDGDNTTTDITTSGTLVLTAQGAIGVSGGNGPLDLAVGILQATTTTGGIFLLENNTLVIGGTGVQTTGGNAAIEIALTLGNLTLNEDITADGSGNITLTLLGAGAILATSAAGVDDIISGSGDITITADALTLAGGVITSSGNLVLQPNATDVAVGVSGGAGAFALATTEIDLLSNGFGSITIGRSDSTALMTINADAFLDPINFRMGGVSGDITLAGAVSTASLAMTFTAGTGATGTFTQSGGGTIATTAGAITITADAIVLDTVNPNTITTIGAITLQPATATTSIGIGGASGTFQLDDAELLTLTNAAASITIGRSDGVHVILIDAIAFTDPVTIRTPNGGSIAVNGNLAASSEATVTLTAGGGQGNTGALGTITIANTFTVSTASQTITLTAQGNITLENVNAVAGNVTITSSQGSILETSTDNLITGATVTLNGSTAAGQSVGVSTGAINTNATTLSGTAGTGGFFVDDSASFGISTITITGAGAVTLTAVAAITDADASAAANITTTGAVSLTAGTFVGTSAANEEVDIDNATALTIDVNEDFHIDGVGGDLVLSDLTITLNTGSGADANTYVLNGISNNTLTLTDATADLTLTAFDQAVAASNLTLINDSGIITVTSFDNTGSGKLTLTASSGGIVLNDGSIATSSGAVTLSAVAGM